MKTKILLLISMSLLSLAVFSQTYCVSNGSNSWSTGFNCSGSGTPVVYEIQAGDSIYYTQSSSVLIDTLKIYGVLNFKTGSKIDMSTPGIVQVYNGGRVIGGNSGTKFRFANGNTVNGPFNVAGPAYIDSSSTSFSAGVLGVEWLDLKASISENELMVEWTTASEENNDYFIVEYSLDGQHFNQIAEVRSKSTNGFSSQILKYSHVIKLNSLPITSEYFIRIKQVDFNGDHGYSGVEVVQNIPSTYKVYRSAEGEISVELNRDIIPDNMALELVNTEGIVVSTEFLYENRTKIKELERGIYIIRLKTPHSSNSYKIAMY